MTTPVPPAPQATPTTEPDPFPTERRRAPGSIIDHLSIMATTWEGTDIGDTATNAKLEIEALRSIILQTAVARSRKERVGFWAFVAAWTLIAGASLSLFGPPTATGHRLAMGVAAVLLTVHLVSLREWRDAREKSARRHRKSRDEAIAALLSLRAHLDGTCNCHRCSRVVEGECVPEFDAAAMRVRDQLGYASPDDVKAARSIFNAAPWYGKP